MATDPKLVRVDPVRSYNFAVTLASASDVLALLLAPVGLTPAAGFSECSGLETTLDIEDYKEGGNNGKVLKFPTRVTWSTATSAGRSTWWRARW